MERSKSVAGAIAVALALILAISIAILGVGGLFGVVLVAVAGARGVIVATGVGVASALAGNGLFGGVVLGIASCAVAVTSGVSKLNDIAIRKSPTRRFSFALYFHNDDHMPQRRNSTGAF